MKKLVGISLFIFFVFTTAVLTSGLVYYQENKSLPILDNDNQSGINSSSSEVEIRLDVHEIAKHGTISDCWIIIDSKVYNVMTYLGLHPGGIITISPFCGKDASNAFSGRPHSLNANSLLAKYYIGDINQTIGTAQIEQNIQNTNSVLPQNQRGNEEDDD